MDLAPLRLQDADELFALTDANRDRLRDWFPWVDRTRSVADTQAFIETTLAPGEVHWAIRDDGVLAGVAGFHRHDKVRGSIELGYWLGEAFEGRGLMTRAVAALCDHAFQTMDVHRIELRAATHNRKSRALAERLGFREEGMFREAELVNGNWHDDVVYAVLAQEWAAR